MEFRVLGEVEAWVGDMRLEVGHARQRCVLAVLLMEAGRVVTTDQLLARVCSDQPIHRARPVLRSYVSRLRGVLAPEGVGIERRSGGYVLLTEPHNVDVHRYRRLVDHARAAHDAELFEQALELWRGEPFAGLDTPWLATVRAGLERERFEALLDYHDVALRSGRDAQLLPKLSTLADDEPLDERIAGQLMLALYRSGRQAGALEHYQRTRRRLAAELGAEPCAPLQRLHQQILTADPALSPAAQAAMFGMRADIPTFMGRQDELDHLLDAVHGALDGAVRAIVIHAVEGMAGVGKTAFSVHAAHRLADDFPDGNLFVELHGHTPGHDPVPPGEALESLLRAAGVAPEAIPPKLDDRARLWRDRMAGKKFLLVLDDAASHDQVRPLLPATAGSLVLITSRHRLAALDGVQPMSLDVLPAAQALDLLRRLAGGSHAEDTLAEIAEWCGHLPLAISLAGAQLRSHASWTARYLADLLAGEHDRLEHLRAGDRSVTAAFTTSYRHLSAAGQSLFRLLGAHPGPDIDAYAAAALADIPLVEARRRLDALHAVHLIAESTAGRYHLHDLVRAYARSLDDDDDNREALSRVLAYYEHTARVANTHLPAYYTTTIPSATTPARTPRLDSEADARAWFTAELPTLAACVSHSARLAAELQPFLRVNGYLEQGVRIHRTAADGADKLGRATALTNLGIALRMRGEHEAAAGHLTQAVELFTALGSPLGQANALNELGRVQYSRDDFEAAAEHLTRALELYTELGDRLGRANACFNLGLVDCHHRADYGAASRRHTAAWELYVALGDRLGQATALNELGLVWCMLCEYDTAADHHMRAHELFTAMGFRLGQANALNYLGYARCYQGEYEAASRHHTAALELYTALGDRLGQAHALDLLGRAEYHRAEYKAAARHHTAALELHSMLGSQVGQANALNYLGNVHHRLGEYEAAARDYTAAMEMYIAHDDPLGQANVLQNLGRMSYRQGQHEVAARHLVHALERYTEMGDRHGVAETLNHLGDLALDHPVVGDPGDFFSRALTIARDIGATAHEAHALAGQGRCLRTADVDQAVALLRQAHSLYHALGSPEAGDVEQILAALS